MVTRPFRCAGALALGIATLMLAPSARALELASCVGGSPPLQAGQDALFVRLDAADRDHFDQAAQARYPLYQRGGEVPTEVLLLQRGGRWLYVTLAGRGPTGRCFTAVFAADRFDFTDRWLRKYRPRAAGEDE